MQITIIPIVIFGLALAPSGSPRPEEIVDKAIKAHGGVAELKKLQNTTQKIKGTIQAMGLEIPFSGDLIIAGENRVRVDIEIDVNGMKIQVINIINKDKGWAKVAGKTMDLDKDKITEARESGHLGTITSLAPLKDKAYTISLVGEDKVGETPAQVVRVSHKDRRDVNLFFDKKTHLLLKTEARSQR